MQLIESYLRAKILPELAYTDTALAEDTKKIGFDDFDNFSSPGGCEVRRGGLEEVLVFDEGL